MSAKMLSASLNIQNITRKKSTKIYGQEQSVGERNGEQGEAAGGGSRKLKFAHTMSLRGVKCQANSLRPERAGQHRARGKE